MPVCVYYTCSKVGGKLGAPLYVLYGFPTPQKSHTHSQRFHSLILGPHTHAHIHTKMRIDFITLFLLYTLPPCPVIHYRVQRLTELSKRVDSYRGAEGGLLALLVLYHSLCPHMLTNPQRMRRKVSLYVQSLVTYVSSHLHSMKGFSIVSNGIG